MAGIGPKWTRLNHEEHEEHEEGNKLEYLRQLVRRFFWFFTNLRGN